MKKEHKVNLLHVSPAIAKQVLAADVKPFLPLELGQTYKTRSGNKVTIRDIDYSYTMPFFGDIVTKENKHVRVASFNAAGMYKNGEQTQFDIVGLWSELQ